MTQSHNILNVLADEIRAATGVAIGEAQIAHAHYVAEGGEFCLSPNADGIEPQSVAEGLKTVRNYRIGEPVELILTLKLKIEPKPVKPEKTTDQIIFDALASAIRRILPEISSVQVAAMANEAVPLVQSMIELPATSLLMQMPRPLALMMLRSDPAIPAQAVKFLYDVLLEVHAQVSVRPAPAPEQSRT